MNIGILKSISAFVSLVVFHQVLLSKASNEDLFPEYRFHTMPETSYYGGIQSIAKDSIGRMWFSGVDVVFLYDGTDFIRMDHRMKGVPEGQFWHYGKIAVGGSGNLYVATNRGLLQYDYKENCFYRKLDGKVTSLDSDIDGTVWFIRNETVESIGSDGTHRVWMFGENVYVSPVQMTIICYGNGVYIGSGNKLYRLDISSGRYEMLYEVQDSSALVIDVLEYGGYTYVLTFMHGLYKIDADGRVYNHIILPERHNEVSVMKELYMDDSRYIWILTQSGILLLNPDTEATKLLKPDLHYEYSLPNNSVWTVYDDPDGGEWIGTYGGKLAYVSPYDDGLNRFGATPGGLNYSIVSCFQEDGAGGLWIGTEGGGLNFWDRSRGYFSYYTANDGKGLSSNMIKRIKYAPDGSLVVASFNGGMKKFNPGLDCFENMGNFLPRIVYDFEYELGGVGIWMSNPDGELVYADMNLRTLIEIHPYDDGNRIPVDVEAIFHDNDGNLGLVTHEGVYIVSTDIDRTTGAVEILHHLYTASADMNSLCCYCKDSDGNIWFGSRGGGATVFYSDGKYGEFTDIDGNSLSGSDVLAIVEDRISGNIWFSTDKGLFCYDKSRGTLSSSRVGNKAHSLNGAQYPRACYCTSGGTLLFGGTDGFIMFSPSDVRMNEQLARPFFTGLKVNNMPVELDAGTKLELSHTESNLEIAFSSNSYLYSEKNRFAYRIVGGASELWSFLPPGQKVVQLFGIPPGKYRFELKAANNDGLWGTRIESLDFRIHPSPFFTWWAYIIYSLGISSIVLLFLFIKKKLDFTQIELKELYDKKYIAGPSNIEVSSADDEIMKRAMTLVEQNMDNSAYDVDAFVADMGVGRTSLYGKISNMTGMSIKEFILDLRLKRASALLKESELTVSEISYMTGFNNPKYFSTCFKKHFGITPTDYRFK